MRRAVVVIAGLILTSLGTLLAAWAVEPSHAVKIGLTAGVVVFAVLAAVLQIQDVRASIYQTFELENQNRALQLICFAAWVRLTSDEHQEARKQLRIAAESEVGLEPGASEYIRDWLRTEDKA